MKGPKSSDYLIPNLAEVKIFQHNQDPCHRSNVADHLNDVDVIVFKYSLAHHPNLDIIKQKWTEPKSRICLKNPSQS